MNLYGYAGGDPINFSDPLGLLPDTIDTRLQEKIGEDLCTAANCDEVTIVTDGPIAAATRAFGAAVTLGTNIYFPRELDPESRGDVAWLAHELGHVVQYRMWGGSTYLTAGTLDRVRDLFGDPYDYSGLTQKPWERWNMEAQASVIGDCFRVPGSAACSLSPFTPPGGGQ